MTLLRTSPKTSIAWIAVGLAMAVIGVAGCEGPKAPEAAVSAAEARPAPVRKPGLWKNSVLAEGAGGVQGVKICLDKEAEKILSLWGQGGSRGKCSVNEVSQRPDGRWTFNSVCEPGDGVKVSTQGSVVGDFSSRYQAQYRVVTNNAPDPAFNGEKIITIDAEWIGECPSGMRPGDMELADGQRMNVLDGR